VLFVHDQDVQRFGRRNSNSLPATLSLAQEQVPEGSLGCPFILGFGNLFSRPRGRDNTINSV
jgi:hypothetical protein